MNRKWIPEEEFEKIYSKVPRLCVEVLVQNEKNEILLTKRAIKPGDGMWHFPGSTVFMWETLEDAVKRTARDELNLEVEIEKMAGILEFKDRENIFGQPVSIAFLVRAKSKNLKLNWQATEAEYFDKVPENILPDQGRFLRENLRME